MATKKLNTRVQHKIDTSANWALATTFIPLKGELIVYSDLHKAKIGDGTTTVGNLPFEAYSKSEIDTLLSNKVDKVQGKQLSTEDYTSSDKSKLSGIESGAQVNIIQTDAPSDNKEYARKNGAWTEVVGGVTSVNSKTGAVVLNAQDVGALPDDTEIPTKTSQLTNDSGYITKAVNDLTNYRTSSAQDVIDEDMQDAIDAIEELIPTQATSSNQLADKNFVNSSIATETAHYISNNGQPFASVEQLEAYSGTVTNNDYAIVTGIDASGNTYFDRYKATIPKPAEASSIWAKEYRINNSSFTAVQWAAINSGVTSALIASYNAHIASTSNPHSVTKAQVGLGNVDNTSDLDKPISTATQTALDAKATTSALTSHTSNTNNPHSVTKSQVGLGNVDNTSDADKPISTATQTALDDKVDKVSGKGLSTNDFTNAEKTKLGGIAEGAEVNVQSDWNQTTTSADDYIKNKPTALSSFTDDINDVKYTSQTLTSSQQLQARDNIGAGTIYGEGTETTEPAALNADTLDGHDSSYFQVAEAGKGLSENDFTDALKTKLDGIEAGAEVNEVSLADLNAKVNYTDKLSQITGTMSDSEKTLVWGKTSNIKTTMDSVAVAGAEYYLGEQTSVAFTLPSDALTGQTVSVVFYSGATATSLSVSGTVIGEVPTPTTNQRVELNMLWDGTNWAVLNNVMEVV